MDKGDIYDPSFLRISPKATIPALVVPLEKTLAKEIDSRYKSLTSVEDILAFLDKSRSAISRTHTTSSAPALSLTPATIAFSSTSKAIIELLHSEDANPNNLEYLNARDDASLKELSSKILPELRRKHDILAQHIADAETEKAPVSFKTNKFWQDKKAALETLVVILDQGEQPSEALDAEGKEKRSAYFSESRSAWEIKLRDVLLGITKQVTGPFSLGDQVCLADLHLASWLVWIVRLAGGSHEIPGDTAINLLESHVGNGFKLPRDYKANGEAKEAQAKLAAFWDNMQTRGSWKKVYGA